MWVITIEKTDGLHYVKSIDRDYRVYLTRNQGEAKKWWTYSGALRWMTRFLDVTGPSPYKLMKILAGVD